MMPRNAEKKKRHPVRNPAADAQERTGVPFAVRRVWNAWEPYMSYCTTGMFEHLEKSYRRHCGPTAVTNVILTLAASEDVSGPEPLKMRQTGKAYVKIPQTVAARTETPQEVFATVARIGMRHGIYWNMDLLHHFGGTQDLRCGEYLRAVLHHYGLRARIIFHQPLTAVSFMDAIRRGSLLYLELRHHPLYGDHHVVCCGMTEVVSTAEKRKPIQRRYLIVADGWSTEPAYLDLAETGFCHFFEIRPEEIMNHRVYQKQMVWQ